MAFNQFQLGMDIGMTQQPNDHYRELQQAFQDAMWENTSAKTPENEGQLYEQDGIGEKGFHCVEAWVVPATEANVTAQRNSGDFIQLVFRSIEHRVTRGIYYKYNGDFWIVHDDNPYDGLTENISIRRCDNMLNLIDPQNGALVSVPCCVDYDMGSPAAQISRYINTPNNHATVIVQGCEDTLRLYKVNTRFMLDGRPFKLSGYQKSVHTAQRKIATLLYLDMYLDEIHAEDDTVEQIADNGKFDYTVILSSGDFMAKSNATGHIVPSVLLNGIEVGREVEWTYDSKVVTIDEVGNYTVIGKDGDSTEIKVNVKGNPNTSTTIILSVGTPTTSHWGYDLTPDISMIRQYETITVKVTAYKDGVATDDEVAVSTDSQNIMLTKGETNTYKIEGLRLGEALLTVGDKPYNLKVVSMMG